jgi:phage gp36-like protein
VPQRLADYEDLVRLGIRAAAIEELDEAEIEHALDAASSEALGYIKSSYVLPLQSWDFDLRMHVAAIAVYILVFGARGGDPEGDPIIPERRNAAIDWLKGVAAGRISPEIVDSTPETFEGGAFVVSSPNRGW